MFQVLGGIRPELTQDSVSLILNPIKNRLPHPFFSQLNLSLDVEEGTWGYHSK